MINPVELIRRKRDGETLQRSELSDFLNAYLKGDVSDYQMSAFLMAVYFRGMNAEETTALTDIMVHSGKTVDLSGIPGVKVDKHSTGGVGDKVSLILAPIVAACGVPVPMISGRGLGHTGGTLDKLESIPGFRTALSIDEYTSVIASTGLVMIGQTEDIAPADKKMYALRDVTATVECVPLIASSIMSKKIAEGIDGLVLDVKTGNGAFMSRYEDALALAKTLVGIGTASGKKTVALLTEMDQPLGSRIGNWCEVVEAVECLKGKRVPDLMEITYALGALMLIIGEKADSIAEGIQKCTEALWSGLAYEKLLALVRAQGGNVDVIEQLSKAPSPAYCLEVKAQRTGQIAGFSTREIGVLAAELGAGRMKVEDVLDKSAGITLRKKLGERVDGGEVVAEVYGADTRKVQVAAAKFPALFTIADTYAGPPPRIRTVVDDAGERAWDPNS